MTWVVKPDGAGDDATRDKSLSREGPIVTMTTDKQASSNSDWLINSGGPRCVYVCKCDKPMIRQDERRRYDEGIYEKGKWMNEAPV